MDLECNVPEDVHQSKSNYKRRCVHEIYDETKPLYIETDALLQTRNNTNCHRDETLNNSIPLHCPAKAHQVRKKCSSIEREALGMLYGHEKFHHYCFVREVSIIMDHKPLIAIFKKDVTTLSQRMQQILLSIHQYRVRIIYKPGPDLFMVA